jgi:hypothetical protein
MIFIGYQPFKLTPTGSQPKIGPVDHLPAEIRLRRQNMLGTLAQKRASHVAILDAKTLSPDSNKGSTS